MIPRGGGSQIFGLKIRNNFTKIKNILTHWSVAKAGANDEKNWRSKISLDCPFKFRLIYFELFKIL